MRIIVHQSRIFSYNKIQGKMKNPFLTFFILAILLGLGIAWIDTRPNWDDTGISVLMVAIAAMLCAYAAAKKPWLIALAVSIWIPLISVVTDQNYGSLLSFIPGFFGAFAGYYLKSGMLKE
jgi:hypothetical protein